MFGAGAQAGVLRYITNKPQLNELSANVKAGYANTSDGDDSYNFEGVVNIPLIDDKLAMRIVAYQDHRGGYIDNVLQHFHAARHGPGLCRAHGRCRSGQTLCVIDNADIAGENINEVDYSGARASLKWQITDDWDALLAVAYQKIDGEGVFYQHPNGSDSGCGALDENFALPQNCPQSTQRLKPLEVTVFNEGYTKDEFINTALTVSGKVGTLDLVYAGAYLTRDAETVSDYTNYARGLYGTYYQCTVSGKSDGQVLHTVELTGTTVRQHQHEPGDAPEQSNRLAHALRRRSVLRGSRSQGQYGLALQVGSGVPGQRRLHGQLLPLPRPACCAEVPVGDFEQPESPPFRRRLLQRFHA